MIEIAVVSKHDCGIMQMLCLYQRQSGMIFYLLNTADLIAGLLIQRMRASVEYLSGIVRSVMLSNTSHNANRILLKVRTSKAFLVLYDVMPCD